MGTEIRDLSKRWYDTHHVLTPEEQREALAHTLARELTAGATWDGVGGLKERGLVRSAPEGRRTEGAAADRDGLPRGVESAARSVRASDARIVQGFRLPG